MGNKKLVVGILAHVDAGKTTLAESILYTSGSIRKLGRVDHKDAFLDTDSQERERGITIFSKQAVFSWRDVEITLLDTPGHMDFSAEMERTLQVLDYAVLVISGADGVQAHVLTLWRLLERYCVPVFLFVNKMDQQGVSEEALLRELKDRLDKRCVSFGERDEEFYEEIAVCDEELLERYLESDTFINNETIKSLVARRKVFPCFFGSALKVEGVEELLNGLDDYTRMPHYTDEFGARVYKIARDAQGVRLTYVKITGGTLKVKQTITSRGNLRAYREGDGPDSVTEEKVDQIRIYSGSKYTVEQEASAGTVCALTGPAATFSGEGLGAERENTIPLLEPIMTYRIVLPEGCDVHQMYQKLCQLEEEEPQLHIVWKEQLNEIQAQLMGEVQIEILKNIIRERFGVDVDFDEGSIVYKETILAPVEGVGHYEPLKHYAEVHLIMEPGEPGSGLTFDTRCSEDVLERNWQRLVLTHLEEKEHLGVLTGSPITDMQITLATGRAHLKHTEGGDFRQATYRAVRHGLCKAQSILLEPVYAFRLELPASMIGRGMTDMQAKSGKFGAPESMGDYAVLTGTVPASEMAGYQAQVLAYSGGQGRLYTELKGYEPCHNAQEVIEAIGYDAQRDTQNPCSSVFCAHGAGFVVEWEQVEDYMHLENVMTESSSELQEQDGWNVMSITKRVGQGRMIQRKEQETSASSDFIGQDEIDEIMNRTYGTKERKKQGWAKTIRGNNRSDREVNLSDKGNSYSTLSGKEKRDRKNTDSQEEYLLVDGYNIIFAWDYLKELAEENLDGARGRLMDILSNFQGSRGMHLILVFDAYKVKGNPGSMERYHNIDVVYTKEAETADQYIEKVTHEIGRKHRVRVATSDGLEQLIIMGAGAVRVSAGEFWEEVTATSDELRQTYLDGTNRPMGDKKYLFADASDEVTAYVEQMRLGNSADYLDKTNREE
ncbi:MAG: TetM/TetW/TetO/TetS family tetracycline resistance ribosomal protection protein [Lachnospiraceae bacterium]|nr:TetM/TetW/TetO/TetS family tetracycline resistance ribosomal protection protein [Lachnospiraceae bacterium]